jgi:TolB protein
MNAFFNSNRKAVVVVLGVVACVALVLGLVLVAASCAGNKSGVSGAGGCEINAQFMTDVTVPDGTQMAGGTAFDKTWRMKNNGTCAWEDGTKFAYASGDSLGGPASVNVPAVAVGSSTDVTVNFTAPVAPGTYRSNWSLQTPSGAPFGPDVHVEIVVPAAGGATPTAGATEAAPTPAPTLPPAPTATPTPTPKPTPTPTPTPFGGGHGRIVYVSFRDGNAEIYTMGANDAAPTRLTNAPEIDNTPSWSADGKKIVFERILGSKPNIFTMNADGSGQVNLTHDSSYDTDGAWSPDGSSIAFASDRAGGALQIWTMKPDGSAMVKLTTTPQLNDAPNYSPNGGKIAFESQRDGQSEIYVMNANGTGQTRLTHSGKNYAPKWSPDGSRIAFVSSSGISVMNADGSNLTLIAANASHPAWSPNGNKIAFDSGRSGNSDLWMMNPDGTAVTQLTTNPAADMLPSWS